MNGTWTFAKPTEADIAFVAAHMREADRREMIRWTGCDPEWGLRHSIALSDVCYAAHLSGGDIPCIFGAMRGNLIESEAVLWSLSTDVVFKKPREFYRASKDGIDLVCREMSDVGEFVNYVDTEYAAAIRWLEHLGAGFSIKGKRPGTAGGVFVQFYYPNPHYKED